MKKWISKLIHQFDLETTHDENSSDGIDPVKVSEEHATLLYMIDTYNKHLLDIDGHPVRKVREILDEFSRQMLSTESEEVRDKVLFRFRQFFSSYRIDECTYIEKTFDDFRGIVWDFVEQLSEDFKAEQSENQELKSSFEELKDAVESNSIEALKNQSRKFIDSYVERQFNIDKRKAHKEKNLAKNLDVVKQKLVEANHSMRLDHLTSAYNRKSFDEHLKQHHRMFGIAESNVSLVMLDIDHFKRINDTYGHPMGDFVLKECVRTLHELFGNGKDFVARIGGEEFAIVLPDCNIESAAMKAQAAMDRIRAERFVHEGAEFRFTISLGISQLTTGETVEQWLKRTDEALYASKNTGRNRYTIAPHPSKTPKVA